MNAIPRDAARVILLRNHDAREQALLIRRHADLAFAGGTWVFPGGKLETADMAAAESLAGLRSELIPGNVPREPITDEKGLALVIAAYRETFEETGVMLARHADGTFCGADLARALQPHRAEISRDAALFVPILQSHGLVVDPAHLVFWSHWITPSLSPKRFDTRFFVTPMPPGQEVWCDSVEATELLWLDLRSKDDMPDEALLPAPPTRISLAEIATSLRENQTLERVLSVESNRYVAPVMPKMIRIDGRMTVLLPWDPDYASSPGEGVPPGTQIPPRFLRFPSRAFPPKQLTRTLTG